MQNKDFLESVLSTLPGVNPEQALLNLREMTEAATSSAAQTQEGEDEEEKMEEGEEEKKVTLPATHYPRACHLPSNLCFTGGQNFLETPLTQYQLMCNHNYICCIEQNAVWMLV